MVWKTVIRHTIIVATWILSPLVLANNAPVVDLTQESNHEAANSNVYAPPAVDAQLSEQQAQPPQSSSQPPQQSQQQAPGQQEDMVNTAGMTTQQRLERLERQMNNVTRMNAPQQIAELQQEVQQLRGQLQVEAHNVTTLSRQQKPAQVEQSVTPPPTAAVASASVQSTSQSPAEDTNAYNIAFNFLRAKKIAEASKSFSNYLATYPKGIYRDNAYYWLGDIYMLQYKYPQSVTQFNNVITQFPKSSKVPDAKLKLAMIHITLGKSAIARKELEALKKDYPGTTAAQLAGIQLQQINGST